MTFVFQLSMGGLYEFGYFRVNSYFCTITILVQDMEKFYFKKSFATLRRPHLLYYMTFVFQPYIVIRVVSINFILQSKQLFLRFFLLQNKQLFPHNHYISSRYGKISL